MTLAGHVMTPEPTPFIKEDHEISQQKLLFECRSFAFMCCSVVVTLCFLIVKEGVSQRETVECRIKLRNFTFTENYFHFHLVY